ncbi:hypothetical protein XIS1_2110001 [Xenorhabdus innexi]|uniref:Uncharacterized protein n=1 Tax=Xenorhabdus innexi TaxID=290109 RepID=A0A1N6MXB3_9GAMM|nr:hypothetical protein XIS1_2110001 [Xenorhabdus innexi]
MRHKLDYSKPSGKVSSAPHSAQEPSYKRRLSKSAKYAANRTIQAVTPDPQLNTSSSLLMSPLREKISARDSGDLYLPLFKTSVKGMFMEPGTCPRRKPALGSATSPENLPNTTAVTVL